MPVNSPYRSSIEGQISNASRIINSFFDSSTSVDSAVPSELIKHCKGLAFLTVIKVGMVWTGKVGTGIVIAKLDDGTWSGPSGIGTAGVGFGAEIGGELIDFMIILGTDSAVRTFKKGAQISVGAGLDLAVGPVGRSAGASIAAGTSGFSANYTYSRSKGFFAGVGLHGSTILVRGELNRAFYGYDAKPMEILSGHVLPPEGACDVLYEAIARAIAMDPFASSMAVDRVSNSAGSSRRLNNGYPASSSSNNYRDSSNNYRDSSNNYRDSSNNYRDSSNNYRDSSYNRSSSSTTTNANSNFVPPLSRPLKYKSEAELYAEFAAKKASGSSNSANSGSGSASMSVPPPAPAAQGPVHTYSHPTNPKLTYSSYPAPSNQVPYPNARQGSSVSSSTSSGYTPTHTATSYHTMPPIPEPAVGGEIKHVYTSVLNFISTHCPRASIQTFKDNCRLFGQDGMPLDAFYAYLNSIATKDVLMQLMPQLVRLLPTEEKRQNLWAMYARQTLQLRV